MAGDALVDAIAIVGMAGRFPGARDVDTFWQRLANGECFVESFSDDELRAAGVSDESIADPGYVKAGVCLEDVADFDAGFFGFNPNEASIMDPQHRLFLESAWHAIEDAGYTPAAFPGSIGVYAGASQNDYYRLLIEEGRAIENIGSYLTMIGNDKDYLATRVSYKLGLTGPSLTVQTGCSTSLVAIHLACQSLLGYQCDMAIAGGVSINLPQRKGYLYQPGMILSPDGRCRAFDADAAGTVPGEGVGIVVLRRLSDAIADRDNILAVVRGSAINNDGANKVGFTAPSVDGQADVVATAQAIADINPEDISYIEAHGTGTPLGDPIEIAALCDAFGQSGGRKGFCAIGSVKTNIGHLDAAAGVAGLMKTVMALKHHQIPPSLHFKSPNPEIDFANSPFFVNDRLRDWTGSGRPLRAGVSSFGIGGTNAHLVVEEAPESPVRQAAQRLAEPLVLSARSESAVRTAAHALSQQLASETVANISDVACTLATGRQAFDFRLAICAGNTEQAVKALESARSIRRVEREPVIAFLCTGQGAQYPGMAKSLYQNRPAFKDAFDRCAELFIPELEYDLRERLFADRTDAFNVNDTAHAQPALFAVEWATASLWSSLGLKPNAVAGHSIGEYVAACLSAVLTLEDAIGLVALRGRLMQSMPPGDMLAVHLGEAQLSSLVSGSDVELSAINAPALCTVSGSKAAIARFADLLGRKEIAFAKLHTSHAFHSQTMQPAADEFLKRAMKAGDASPPAIPFVSALTGEWHASDRAPEPEYWARQLREPVRFSDCFQRLVEFGCNVFVETGPGDTLCKLARAHDQSINAVASLPGPGEPGRADETLARAAGTLWEAGATVDWAAWYAQTDARRVRLPGYPFERKRYWIAAEPGRSRPARRVERNRADIGNWFYAPVFSRDPQPAPEPDAVSRGPWLVFAANNDLSESLYTMLCDAGAKTARVLKGNEFTDDGDGTYCVRADNADDYAALFDALEATGHMPRSIAHLWLAHEEDADTALDDGLHSLLTLARAVGSRLAPDDAGVDILAVTSGVYDITGDETITAANATVLGAVKVIPLEYPELRCRHVDVDRIRTNKSTHALLRELCRDTDDALVGLRAGKRWLPGYTPLHLPAARSKDGHVYLITGGLGGMGLEIAEHLGQKEQAKFILVGRSALPERADWARYLETHDNDAMASKLRKLLELEKKGVRCLAVQADVANLKQMKAAVGAGEKLLGPVTRVIHAAGIIDHAGVIHRRDKKATESSLAPKIEGARVLDSLFVSRKLDRLILFSSIGTVLYHAKFGQAGYVAANEYLDAWAFEKRRSGLKVAVINWDDWLEVGMTVQAERHFAEHFGALDEHAREGIPPEAGAEALRRVLAFMPERVVITAADLDAALADDLESESPFLTASLKQSDSSSQHARPDLATAYAEPATRLEQDVAEIWGELLGIERVGSADDFFELGGHSLLATQCLARLRRRLDVDLNLNALFEDSTVEGLASRIEKIRNKDADAAGPDMIEGEL